MALVLVGVTLAQTAIGPHLRGALVISVLKTILHPLLMWGAGRALGLTGLPLAVMVVAAALPVGANVFLFSQRYKKAEDLVTASVAVSTLMAVGTVSVVMGLLVSFLVLLLYFLWLLVWSGDALLAGMCARQRQSLLLSRQKKVTKEKGDPLAASLRFAAGNLRCSRTGCAVELTSRLQRSFKHRQRVRSRCGCILRCTRSPRPLHSSAHARAATARGHRSRSALGFAHVLWKRACPR